MAVLQGQSVCLWERGCHIDADCELTEWLVE